MTDQEHAGATSGWWHYVKLGRIAGVDTLKIPVQWPSTTAEDPVAAIVRSFEDAFASFPYRVVAVSHVLTTTGVALPLARIAAVVHAAGAVLVVDGAQVRDKRKL